MSTSSTAEELVKSSQEFLVPLRMGDGFDASKFEAFCDLIIALRTAWKESDSIPKSVANVFIDAYTAMVSSSYLYPDQTQHVQHQADLLNELIRACCE